MKTITEIRKCRRLRIETFSDDGGTGLIRFPESGYAASVIWSYWGGWDHVSMAPYRHEVTPSWDDMCKLKDIFFREDETVIQYHPAKSQYVNMVTNCLHLWRPQNEILPVPPSIMIGLRDGQTAKEAREEMALILEDGKGDTAGMTSGLTNSAEELRNGQEAAE